MQAFMWQEDLTGVAKFINACLHKTLEGQTSDQPSVVKHLISLVWLEEM